MSYQTMPEDDDFLIPRTRNSLAMEVPPAEPASGPTIDKRSLEERLLRKKRIAPQPQRVGSEADEPWKYLDQRVGEDFPAFEARMWTLGETARWVAERTPEAVNGLSIDVERLFEIVPEIQVALAAGELRAFAHTPNDPVPHELPMETWAVYQLAVEERDGLLWIVVVLAALPDGERALLDTRLEREDVLQRWPGDQESMTPRLGGTVAAEHRCRLWLISLMKANPSRPRAKQELRDEAKLRFAKLGNRVSLPKTLSGEDSPE
jgi:hypothetical protein